MASVDIEAILTIIYVRVDDWYQTKGHLLLKGKVGAKPAFSDSEMITFHLALFPELLDQSQFNRRLYSLRLVVETLRRDWLMELGIEHATHFLLDTNCQSS